MRAMALPRGGHVYKVWMEDGLSFTNIGSLALSVSEANGRFLRDTRKGQPLPLQVRQIGDLSGRSILIIDEFDEIVLEGVVP
jgi:hypoxanthine phosphoribosyltransferase